MNCCICGKEIKRKQSAKVKYPTCGDPYCQRLVRRKYHQEKVKKESKMTETRLAGIKHMRKELTTQWEFIKAMAGRNGANKLARQYGILRTDVMDYKKEILAGLKPSEIRKLQREALSIPITAKREAVTVLKIIDPEAFEKGGIGTYDGTEFVRLEQAREVPIQFDTRLK